MLITANRLPAARLARSKRRQKHTSAAISTPV
ncbi:Uncharacterised protein [Bordetella pertussis]|nr:Uncharacterised protein [Bordetella pertussis]